MTLDFDRIAAEYFPESSERQARCLAALKAVPIVTANKLAKELTVAIQELHFLRDLEGCLKERRAMEPRHSHPDHGCVECEILQDLRVFRRSQEGRKA